MPRPLDTPLTVRVPASTSNLGAGFDCLGLALHLRLEVRLEPGRGDPIYTGRLAGLDPQRDLIHRSLVEADLADIGRLTVDSPIPISRGLGSSAAARVAAHTLIALGHGTEPDRDAIFTAVARAEGHPDNAAPAVYGGLRLVTDPDHTPAPLPMHPDLGVALAVPEQTVETQRARSILPMDVGRSVAIAQAARAAALVTGLASGDEHLIRFGMEDQLAVPYRRSLIRGYDAAVAAATDAGAYGCTISGSGSTMLAVVRRDTADRVAAAMARALTTEGNPAEPLAPAIHATGTTWVRGDPLPVDRG